jgi:hypothetical protein
MSTQDRLERIQALWQGDAVQDTTLLWRCLRKKYDDPERIVEAIEAIGHDDAGMEVEPDTLAAMREIAAESDEHSAVGD